MSITSVLILLGLLLPGGIVHAIESDCEWNLSKFLEDAPNPRQVIDDYVGQIGDSVRALVGPASIRDRFDRAFFRYLLAKFEVLTRVQPNDPNLVLNDITYRVTKFNHVALVIHRLGRPRPVVDWSGRRGYGRASAGLALQLAEARDRADTWLDLDRDVGLSLLAELIATVAPERRDELQREMALRAEYLERVRVAFNHHHQVPVAIDPTFRARPKSISSHLH